MHRYFDGVQTSLPVSFISKKMQFLKQWGEKFVGPSLLGP